MVFNRSTIPRFPFRIAFTYRKLKEKTSYRGWYYSGWNNGQATVDDPALMTYNKMEISYTRGRRVFMLTFVETDWTGRDK